MPTTATSEVDCNSKGRAIMVEKAADRISTLPEELVCHILSLLPTIDAVRTTVLSARWKDKWTSVRNLEFSDEHFNDHPEHFLSFVNRVLLFRNSSSEIHKFSIAGTGDLYHTIGQATASYLEDWICTAVRCNLDEPEVSGFNGLRPFKMPVSLLMSKAIMVFNLSKLNPYLSFDPPLSGSCFPSLKSLHVELTREDEELNKLIRSCPVLEELTICGLLGSLISPCHHVQVFALELKTLVLRCKGFSTFLAMLNLYIDAPKLENLHIEEPLLPKIVFYEWKTIPCHYCFTRLGNV